MIIGFYIGLSNKSKGLGGGVITHPVLRFTSNDTIVYMLRFTSNDSITYALTI